MRVVALLFISLALAGCQPDIALSDIPEQADARPVYAIGLPEKIRIVGSSTVAPFATTVAEQFGATSRFPAPIVETTGTGGGFKAFCQAVGPNHPSIVNASRRIKVSEQRRCETAGIVQPLEVKIGYDGIVLAQQKSSPHLSLSKAQIYLALAAQLPDGQGGWRPNPHRLWRDVDPSLPDMQILVSGPPPTSGTRDAFVDITLQAGALAVPQMLELSTSDPEQFRLRARQIRNDGAWIDSGENDSSIINTLLRNEDAVGVVGYSFLEQNMDRIRGAQIDGVAPSFANIAEGKYGVSRSMFFYVKLEHMALVPGLEDFVSEFTQEAAWGPTGYLVEKGLIPLQTPERERIRTAALTALTKQQNPRLSDRAPSLPQTAADRLD